MSETLRDRREPIIARPPHEIEKIALKEMLPWLMESDPEKWVAIHHKTLIGIYDSFSVAFEGGASYTESIENDLASPLVIQILEQQLEDY